MFKSSLKLSILILTLNFNCTQSKSKQISAIFYNENLVKIINSIDSSRNLIGDDQNETLLETETDIKNFSQKVIDSKTKIDSLMLHPKDISFKKEVDNFITLNKQFAYVDFQNLLILKKKLAECKIEKDKNEIIYLIINISDQIESKLILSNQKIVKAQNNFSTNAKLRLK